MKKITFMIISLLFISSISAQSTLTVEQRAQQQTDQLANFLTLTSPQKPKVYEAVLTKLKQIDLITSNFQGTLTQEQKTAKANKIKAAKDAFDKEMKIILTPQQYEKWVKEGNKIVDKTVETNSNNNNGNNNKVNKKN